MQTDFVPAPLRSTLVVAPRRSATTTGCTMSAGTTHGPLPGIAAIERSAARSLFVVAWHRAAAADSSAPDTDTGTALHSAVPDLRTRSSVVANKTTTTRVMPIVRRRWAFLQGVGSVPSVFNLWASSLPREPG